MSQNWIELFEGLTKGAIPFEQTGYILVANFDKGSNYAVIQLIAFKNVKNIVQSSDGVTFHSDGAKAFIVHEPVTYRFRFQEPYLRSDQYQVPLRWNEVHLIEMPKHDKIFISKVPFMSHGSFTIENPEEGNFVYYFFDNDRLKDNLDSFISTILRKDLKVPVGPAKEILEKVFENLEQFKVWAHG